MEVHVAIRPEKMSIQTEPPADSDRESLAEVGFNFAQGKIQDLAYLGSLTTYHVKLDSGMVVKVTHTNAARHDSTQLTWGDTVYVWWCGSDLVVLTS
jgi:putrescine transport system ATP-binding protein